MAKLSGVKTLDMVNGEITKVAYEGEEYVKFERGLAKAQTGDLMMADEYTSDMTDGGFYAITIDSNRHHSVRFTDDEGSNNGYTPKCSIHTLFRKVGAHSAEPTTANDVEPKLTERLDAIEKRVDALEGEKEQAQPTEPTYVKIAKSEAQEGDYVYFDYAPRTWLTDENYYEIIEIDGAGDPQIIDDEGDMFDTYEEHFAVYRKVGVEQQEEPTLKKAGNYVKFGENLEGITAGKFYELQVDSDGDLFFRDDDNDPRYSVLDDDSFGAEYFAEKEEQPALKVGDYAKTLTSGLFGKIDANAIVKIISEPDIDGDIECENILDEGFVGLFQPEQLVPATDAEVEQAKSQAVEAKWAKIGRKVGEIKVGDIGRIVKYECGYSRGTIVEVVDIGVNDLTVSSVNNGKSTEYFAGTDAVELITPVEARFDRADAE